MWGQSRWRTTKGQADQWVVEWSAAPNIKKSGSAPIAARQRFVDDWRTHARRPSETFSWTRSRGRSAFDAAATKFGDRALTARASVLHLEALQPPRLRHVQAPALRLPYREVADLESPELHLEPETMNGGHGVELDRAREPPNSTARPRRGTGRGLGPSAPPAPPGGHSEALQHHPLGQDFTSERPRRRPSLGGGQDFTHRYSWRRPRFRPANGLGVARVFALARRRRGARALRRDGRAGGGCVRRTAARRDGAPARRGRS